jgi:uncharacterized sporulation protein YeaH/YhbH (DUF444 family)
MNAKEWMTDLDILGMQRALREWATKGFGFWRERRVSGAITALGPLDELLKRDEEREKDGFPKKIKFRRVLAGPGKVIVVPYVEEEKLVHGEFEPKQVSSLSVSVFLNDDEEDIGETLGHGKGEVGDVIDEVPLPFGVGEGDSDGGEEPSAGVGTEPGLHGFEEEAYAKGRELTERFQLPNLIEKRKKVPSDEYTYDLTDRYRGSGQVLDKRETLKHIVKTNIILGRVQKDDLDPSQMLVAPEDKVFRILSQEKVWKSQAIVFFLRDYSGSMWGEPSQALISQHLMIYAWLLVQYEKLVIPRFIVHDTTAKEVTAQQYFTLQASGGTLIASAYKKVNEIVESEGLERDYNIYVFQGTDGDDFDQGGRQALPELEKILRYVNRMGATVLKHPYYLERNQKTSFEAYLEDGGILQRRDLFRIHVMTSKDITEEDNIEALKELIAQD